MLHLSARPSFIPETYYFESNLSLVLLKVFIFKKAYVVLKPSKN